MSKYLIGSNQTDRTLRINPSGVRLEYSARYFKLISHVLLDIHAVLNLHVRAYVKITSDL